MQKLEKNQIAISSKYVPTKYTTYTFLFGLFIWILSPIIGIFILLLSIQLNILKSKQENFSTRKINNFTLILVVFTVSTFFASYTVYSDLFPYIEVYEKLNVLNPFEATEIATFGSKTEYVLYLIAYPVYYLTNGSVFAFMFNHALVFNILVVFLVAKRLSVRYYPILLIVAFSSQFYYWNMVIMRNALSNVFLLASVATIESPWILFSFCLILTLFSHLSNTTYIFILIILRIIFQANFSKKLLKPLSILFLFLFSSIGFIISNNQINKGLFQNIVYFSRLINLNVVADVFQSRDYLDLYSRNIVPWQVFIPILTIFVLSAFSFFVKRKLSIKNIALFYLFVIQTMSFVPGLLFSGFQLGWRFYFLLISFYGFFLPIILDNFPSSSVATKRLISISLGLVLVCNISSFIIQISQGWLVTPNHVFFQGYPVSMNLFDYIIFLLNGTPNY